MSKDPLHNETSSQTVGPFVHIGLYPTVSGIVARSRTYGNQLAIDWDRLALWQTYVAATAQRFMGDWGLASDREAHMRKIALTSIQEAGAALMHHAEFY